MIRLPPAGLVRLARLRRAGRPDRIEGLAPELVQVLSIDIDESAVLEALDRAVALAPDDPLFAEARRFVASESDAVTEEER